MSLLRSHRDFRLLFVGQVVSSAGSEITYVAVAFQIYALTHSSLAVGLLGLAELVPLLAAAFLGGVLADARDRRRMVQCTELLLAGGSVLLVANALLPDPRLWVLYAVAAAMAGVGAVQRPSLEALVPRLVERECLPAASALATLRMTVGSVGGPALAGVLLAAVGLPLTYLIDVATFVVSLAALARMRAVPAAADAERPSLAAVLVGLRYARGRPELLGTYLVDLNAMFFGMPTALFPAIATRYGGPGVLGLLYAAPSLGALVATATSGWTAAVHRHGRAILLAAGCWGLAVVGFGIAGTLPTALAMLALAGAADMVSGLFRTTLWNQTIPDHLRGRLAGIELVSYATGPLLGNVEAGAVAAVTTPRFSVVSGGVLCVLGTAVLAAALPEFRRYDDRAASVQPVRSPAGSRSP